MLGDIVGGFLGTWLDSTSFDLKHGTGLCFAQVKGCREFSLLLNTIRHGAGPG